VLQVLIYPVTDLTCSSPSYRTFAEGYLLTAKAMAWFIEHYLGDTALASDPRASPLHNQNFSELPPALIHTAGFDPLRDEGRAYADRLQSAGIPLEYTCHGDLAHGYWALGGAVRAARLAIAGVAVAAGRALREAR
jgi:acetyl esterase